MVGIATASSSTSKLPRIIPLNKSRQSGWFCAIDTSRRTDTQDLNIESGIVISRSKCSSASQADTYYPSESWFPRNLFSITLVEQLLDIRASSRSDSSNSYIDTLVNEDVVAKFNDLYRKWEEETSVISSTEIFDNRYYQEIIALGKAILPTLIDQLDGSSTFLFFALYRITGNSPVLPEHYGDIAAMTDDWRNWWEENKE